MKKADNRINFKSILKTYGTIIALVAIIIAFGIWMLVLQNLGIIPVTQDVRVKNTIDADVSGSVYVDGGTISVE